MFKKSNSLSYPAMHRIIKKAGAQRVSFSALKELSQVLEEVGIYIAKEAIILASHTGRVTVKARDVRLATQLVLKLDVS
jgi:histone H3/H4